METAGRASAPFPDISDAPRRFDVACLAAHGTPRATGESDAHGYSDTSGSWSGVRADVRSRVSVESAFSVRR